MQPQSLDVQRNLRLMGQLAKCVTQRQLGND